MTALPADVNRFVPQPGMLLVRKVDVPTAGKILLPQGAGTVGMYELVRCNPFDSEFMHPGQRLVCSPSCKPIVELDGSHSVIRVVDVLATSTSVPDSASDATRSLLPLPDWKQFQTDDYENVWKHWRNVALFGFKVGILEPFQPMVPIARVMYENTVKALRTESDAAVRAVRFSETQGEGGKKVYVCDCGDDSWSGGMVLREDRREISFIRHAATLESIVSTTPAWMRAMRNTVTSPAFRSVSGTDYERVHIAVINIRQVIRLEGKGRLKLPVTNSELMGQFLKLGESKEGAEDPLGRLGLFSSSRTLGESIGRVDLSLAFRRSIGDHEYTVFLSIEAPSNEESRLLFTKWEIQDHSPGDLGARDYGAVLTEFFRDAVLRSFYKEWLGDYECASIFPRGSAE